MRKIEFAIGVFVCVGLILLGIMVVQFGDYQYSGKQYVIYAVFNYTGGVIEGAPVRYAGVDVGKISVAELFESSEGLTKVRLGLNINEDVKIKQGSEAIINSLGIIGEKYVEIFPGPANAEFIVPGEEIYGTDPVTLEEVVAKAGRVLVKLEDALGSVNNILTEETQANVREGIVNFKQFGEDVDRLTNKIEVVIDKINTGEGTIGQLIYAQELYDELLTLIKNIKEHGIFYKAKSARKELDKGKERPSFTTRSKN